MKHPPYFSPPPLPDGFTLVELLVVISILTVMGVSAMVGFGDMGERWATQQAGGAVEDFIAQLEAEILMGQYENSTLYFQPHYLMAVSDPKGSQSTLKWIPEKDELCGQDHYYLTSFEAGNLAIKDGRGNLLSIKAMLKDSFECLHFKGSEEGEWQVQLRGEESYSSVIRWLHFHFEAEKKTPLHLSAEQTRLEFSGPYAKRTLYYKNLPVKEAVSVFVQSKTTDAFHELTLQP